jgi:dihydrodipicolinate synthase/N-acetylneuraminate lyase
MRDSIPPAVRAALQRGLVIPACPLALTGARKFDERRQRALFRYYLAAGAGGLAVGVHTTQFAIRDPSHALFEPVLKLAIEELQRARGNSDAVARIAGICGATKQAAAEAALARGSGYHVGLLSLGALREASDTELIRHCQDIARIIPLMGFYLQPAVGGRVLPYSFWRKFAEIENIVAIKIAPFNRYQTIEVLRAIAESGRNDIALYTGNDDNIVMDLLTPFAFKVNGQVIVRRIMGGLLGQWAVWTSRAVELLRDCHRLTSEASKIPGRMLRINAQLTDTNAAIFDASNNFAGCIPGIHEVLRRQGLFKGIWCLEPQEKLSMGQKVEIDRVYAAYPHLNDDQFVREHLDEWLR